MNTELLSAVQDCKPWLVRFTRTEYAEAFREYGRTYAAAYRGAIRAAGGNLSGLAGELLDALADGWKREKFWRRSTRRFEEKQMIFRYLSPMLLEIGGAEFAGCLRDTWRARWPKDAYKTVTWKKLQDGFRLAILGVEIGPRQVGDED